jgi:radical SAM protein with 4Fe4S-binding SPASM domain
VDCGKTEEQKLEIYREWVNLVEGIDLIPSILSDNRWENKDKITKTYEMDSPPNFCHFPFDTLAISWDGKVTGCCLDYVFNMNLGDITKRKLKQIWLNSKFQILRRDILRNKFPVDSPCHGCEFWKINFKPRDEIILKGQAKIKYGYIYRNIKKMHNN